MKKTEQLNKKNKNSYRTPECNEDDLMSLHRETQELIEQESRLDSLIEDVTACLRLVKDDPIDKPYR